MMEKDKRAFREMARVARAKKASYDDGVAFERARIAAVMHCAPADGDDLVEAVRLLVAERDAAVAQREALVTAVQNVAAKLDAIRDREICEAERDVHLGTHAVVSGSQHYAAACAAIECADVVRGALTATPVAMVRADVVRELVKREREAVDAYGSCGPGDGLSITDDEAVAQHNASAAIDTARTALDAALAAAGGV